MASGGEGGGRGSFKDLIVEELSLLLKNFICRWLQRHGFGDAIMNQEVLNAMKLLNPRQHKVSQALQDIGDQVDGDGGLRRLTNDPSIIPTKEVFLKVVCALFSDGKISWGRVVSVFWFACLLVMKVHENRIFDIIRDIITWTIDYFRDKVINWIKEQGGWEGIYSHFGTPTWQVAAIFLAGVLTTLFVVQKI
ncbi:apoptosis regulator BAX-like [Girardinichthys multiradiatus]|uniref:apoptosis regulator BAX-like n=1 Tax=Girardinichthys multiradiatus TaxID=208333 RepID=UPI001FADD655|nr:apoptosis regulator BAX-like [Girardinichthys multiradiatus]